MVQTESFFILDNEIRPGETQTIHLDIAQLHTMTELKIPIIVSHSQKKGPVVLFTVGLHGDELNGFEIVRRFIRELLNSP